MEHLKRFGTGVAALMLALVVFWLVYLLGVAFCNHTMYAIGILAILGFYFFGWLIRSPWLLVFGIILPLNYLIGYSLG